MSLEKRLQALEKSAPSSTEIMVILTSFVGDDPVRIVANNGQEWHRQPGEDLESFRARATAGPFLMEGLPVSIAVLKECTE